MSYDITPAELTEALASCMSEMKAFAGNQADEKPAKKRRAKKSKPTLKCCQAQQKRTGIRLCQACIKRIGDNHAQLVIVRQATKQALGVRKSELDPSWGSAGTAVNVGRVIG